MMYIKHVILAGVLVVLMACATTQPQQSMYPHCLRNSDCNPGEVCKRQLCTASLVKKKEKHLRAAAPAPAAMPASKKSTTLAVMRMLDETGLFNADSLETVTVFLRSKLAGGGITLAIDPASQKDDKKTVREFQKESHKARYDTAYQVELGKALSANVVLKSTVRRMGETCTLACELLDVTSETVSGMATANFNCSEKGLSSAVEVVAPQLRKKMCK